MAIEITVPQMGESVLEGTVGRWLKQPGDAVAEGEPIVSLETDKVDLDVQSSVSGILTSILKSEGETVTIGEALAVIDESATPEVTDEQPVVKEGPRGTPSPESGASPLARKMAEEHALDLRMVKGSGPHGRIMKGDVADVLERIDDAPATATALAAQKAERQPPVVPSETPSVTEPSGRRPEERVRMSRRRQTIATRLVEAQKTAAMLTTFNEADMSAVMALRARHKKAFEERHGVSLGFMSFFTKAAIAALKEYPILNAEVEGDEIVYKKYYDLGIAVAADEGLVVPVIRDADRKSFAELEREIADLAKRARDGELTLAEIRGGTFTITNGGVFGSMMSTPILNTPQVGILGMHRIMDRPIAVDGEVVIRPMMYLALSYDHRIVEGSDAVRFLVRVKQMIEEPERMMLE